MSKHALWPLVLVVLSALAGCAPAPPPAPPAQPAQRVEAIPAIHELSAAEIQQYLAGGTETIEPSAGHPVNGDIRPFWIVIGRIKNNYSQDISTTKILVTAYDKKTHEVLDSAQFEVDDIPRNSTRAFRHQIQLMVQWNKFDSYDTILSATAESSVVP
jgi:hypothetical protein